MSLANDVQSRRIHLSSRAVPLQGDFRAQWADVEPYFAHLGVMTGQSVSIATGYWQSAVTGSASVTLLHVGSVHTFLSRLLPLIVSIALQRG